MSTIQDFVFRSFLFVGDVMGGFITNDLMTAFFPYVFKYRLIDVVINIDTCIIRLLF